ncbi:MAG: hypothetical protein U5N85_10975 [Arcicella sp.]|nr:hypothetical protein [Arcicella sp.]
MALTKVIRTLKSGNISEVKTKEDNSIPDSRFIEGEAPKGTKMSDLFRGVWAKDVKRLTADEIRKQAWQRNNGR